MTLILLLCLINLAIIQALYNPLCPQDKRTLLECFDPIVLSGCPVFNPEMMATKVQTGEKCCRLYTGKIMIKAWHIDPYQAECDAISQLLSYSPHCSTK
jgi:hypothetical protein